MSLSSSEAARSNNNNIKKSCMFVRRADALKLITYGQRSSANVGGRVMEGVRGERERRRKKRKKNHHDTKQPKKDKVVREVAPIALP